MSIIKSTYKNHLIAETNIEALNLLVKTRAPIYGPTDLLATSLGHCILTYIDFVSRKHGFAVPNAHIQIEKTLNSEETSVKKFKINLHVNAGLSKDQRLVVENAARSCPVGNSLNGDIYKEVIFYYS